MRAAGRIASKVLRGASAFAAPGMTTRELDVEVGRLIASHGGVSAFLGYRGFPGQCCLSVNEAVIHGIGDGRRLQFGDLLKIDVGVRYQGFIGDVAMTLIVGGGSPAIERSMADYGMHLGTAFQLIDDVLDYDGDAKELGKNLGDDLREGKPTPLMAIATEHANASQLQVLQLVGHTRLTDSQVTDVQRVIRETGALDQLEAEISNKTDEAIAAIQQAPITDAAREELVALAAYVSWRSV